MQLAGSVRTLMVILVLGLAGCVVGCGSGSKQVSSTDGMAAAKAVTTEIRKSFQQKLQEAAAKRGPMSKANPRAKPGR
jgi:hypothetical protein